MRVLFVDDDRNVLDGLCRALFDADPSWELLTADGATQALALADAQPIDVLVTDMRMPGRDGAWLLGEIVLRHPRVIRFVLTGQSDERDALRATDLAHRFLRKPCPPDELRAALENAQCLVELSDNARLRALVGPVGTLPAVPSVHAALHRLLADGRASADDVAAVVGRDPAITAKLLQVVNSAFFSRGAHVGDVRRAVVVLGDRLVRSVAMLVGVWEDAPGWSAADLERMQRRALRASVAAKALTPSAQDDEPATAALLADLGHLVLARRGLRGAEPDDQRPDGERPNGERPDALEAERAALGCTHAEVGAYLLALWGLPDRVVRAVRDHHREPTFEAALRGEASAVVALAYRIVDGPPFSAGEPLRSRIAAATRAAELEAAP